MTRSMQLPYICVTVFLQTNLFSIEFPAKTVSQRSLASQSQALHN